MTNRIRIAIVAAAVAAALFACPWAASAQTSRTQAPAPRASDSKTPSPELVGRLTKELDITPEQAAGGSGALFGLAKSRLKPEDFSKVADAVPGMDGLLKAAPRPKQGATADVLGAMGDVLPGKAGRLAAVAGSFQSLGLSPGMAVKFVPIMAKFVEFKGGAGVGKLLAGALK